MSKLFSPITIGSMTLDHRVVMAPLTRMRSEPGDSPGALMLEYYQQRASHGGLIVSEATLVDPRGSGYEGAPGIYADAQIAGWKTITDAVHAKGGLIVQQLWHVGRQSHVSFQPNGEPPLAPSAIRAEGNALRKDGPVPFSMPRALERQEIAPIIEQYRASAARAKAAGFDGVEIHGANGYLPDQFLQDGANKRTDDYGGSVENRARFLLEVTAAAVSVWGGQRVGVRLGPNGSFGSMSDSDPQATFGYVAAQMNQFGLAYLHIIEPRMKGGMVFKENQPPVAAPFIRSLFRGPIIAAGGYTGESAEAVLESGDADLVAFGRDFIANPDLPERLRSKQVLTPYDRSTFYGGTARGYTDYPFHSPA